MFRHILCFIQIPFKICTQYTYTRVHTHTDRGFWRSGGYPLLQLSQSPPNQPAPLPIFLQVPTSSMPIHLWLKILANLMLPSLQETRKWWWWWSSTLLLPGGVYSPQTLQQSFIDLLYIWEYIPFPYLPQYFPLLFPHTLFLSASYFLILSISSPPPPPVIRITVQKTLNKKCIFFFAFFISKKLAFSDFVCVFYSLKLKIKIKKITENFNLSISLRRHQE